MEILRRNKFNFLIFVAPVFVIYTYFITSSIVSTFYYSLTEWDAISPPYFIGFKNYADLFQDIDFGIVMRNTFVGLSIALCIQIVMGLSIAYLLYRTIRGFRIYRALVFLPVVLAPSAIALLFTLVFNSDIGPVNKILEALGLGILKHNWLSDTKVVFYTVLTPMIYQYIGLYAIIMLAVMQSIPEEVLESAYIDGASSFRMFTRIVIPMQWDIILMCIILVTIGTFKAFEHSYIMTWGGPGVRSAFLGVYMYMTTFLGATFGKGSAIAIVILVSVFIITLLFRKTTKKFDY